MSYINGTLHGGCFQDMLVSEEPGYCRGSQ